MVIDYPEELINPVRLALGYLLMTIAMLSSLLLSWAVLLDVSLSSWSLWELLTHAVWLMLPSKVFGKFFISHFIWALVGYRLSLSDLRLDVPFSKVVFGVSSFFV